MRPFALSERALGSGCRVVEVVGELDLAVADQLKAALLAASRETDEVVVVLAECEFIDSTGIATLVFARKGLTARGGRLVLCAPSEQVRRVLEVSGLADGDFLYADVEAALAAGDSA